MNNKHKRILFHLVILASSADCWMMLAWGMKYLPILAAIGLLAGIALCQLYFKRWQHISKTNAILGIIAALLLCCALSSLCYKTWIKLPKLEIITGLLSVNTKIFLRTLTCAMGFIALSSAAAGLLMIFQLLALLSLGFFVSVLMEYLRTGLVPNLPTLVVCGFAAVAAIQSFFSGLILETLRQKDRQDFEMELVRIQA